MINALLAILGEIAADDAARVVVLRGNGPYFQAGADLKWINTVREQDRDENIAVSRRTAEAMRQLNEFPKPTMALVHGGCFGGGIGMIAGCDVVVAEDSAMFAITEARWGLIATIIIGELDSVAAPIIDAFLISAPDAMAGTKAIALEHAAQIMDESYFENLVEVHSDKRISEEAVEGLASFAQKRAPAWYPGKS